MVPIILFSGSAIINAAKVLVEYVCNCINSHNTSFRGKKMRSTLSLISMNKHLRGTEQNESPLA